MYGTSAHFAEDVSHAGRLAAFLGILPKFILSLLVATGQV